MNCILEKFVAVNFKIQSYSFAFLGKIMYNAMRRDVASLSKTLCTKEIKDKNLEDLYYALGNYYRNV